MKTVSNINRDWEFVHGENGKKQRIDLPHTWNGEDGQDGGNDYFRGTCTYFKRLKRPSFPEGGAVYLEFKGVNASAVVYVNGERAGSHDGGYSAFRCNITPFLKDENLIKVEVDNSINDRVYPQEADFTFYGGIYRDVNLICVDKSHFDLEYYGASPIKIDPLVEGKDGRVTVTAYPAGEGEVKIQIFDGEGNCVAELENGETAVIKNVHLWNGVQDPYLYRAVASLYCEGEKADEVSAAFGFRTFRADLEKGFFLNGESYPLRGVCRHQDRPQLGNALTKAEHEEDMRLILELGANTVRLAHYQHDDYFYELCDRAGLVVWAEIPYISRHMKGGNENAESQMRELILQQYNHPSICFWGLSNEITIKKGDKEDMLQTHRRLNELCHTLDPHRLTTTANYMGSSVDIPTAHIGDVESWNLYFGWYCPGLSLNDAWLKKFKKKYPDRAVGISEYGAEGMPNLHAARPRRFDNSEEYQALYHEYMLEFFARNPCLWATHVWNMFDFAADARNQGGEPGRNHKGLVTFDRKTKKDAFYLYKAYWSKEKVLHLCGKRFINRTGRTAFVTVYSNVGQVEIYNNGRLVASPAPEKGGKVYKCKLKLEEKNEIVVKAGGLQDTAVFYKVKRKDPSYRTNTGNSMSWEKRKAKKSGKKK